MGAVDAALDRYVGNNEDNFFFGLRPPRVPAYP